MIRITGSHFSDEEDRRLILRGVNLGCRTKVPFRKPERELSQNVRIPTTKAVKCKTSFVVVFQTSF